jgi:hypothetical protein
MNSEKITVQVSAGLKSYSTVRRGVTYWTYRTSLGGQWYVGTHRIALGKRHGGGGRYFATLADVAANVKAFAALPALIELGAL